MGIAFRHDDKTNVTTWVFDGVVTTEEWAAEVRTQITQPYWPPRANLTDLTSADMSGVSDEDIAKVAAMYTAHGPKLAGVQSAIIADRAFQQARSYESQVAPYGQRVIVFTDVSAGCTWLGIDVGETLSTIRRLRDQLRANPSAD